LPLSFAAHQILRNKTDVASRFITKTAPRRAIRGSKLLFSWGFRNESWSYISFVP
jgi:hypothetical protein